MQSIVCDWPKSIRKLLESVLPHGLSLVLGASGLSLIVFAGLPGRERSTSPMIHHEIFANGDAQFTTMESAGQTRRWTVSCPLPFRGCVARAPGLFMHSDSNGRIRLTALATFGARIAVGSKGARAETPDLFDAPLSNEHISILSSRGAFVEVANHDEDPDQFETVGLATVANYLSFLESPLGRILRDARVWRPDGQIDPDAMEPEVKARYKIMRRREVLPDA